MRSLFLLALPIFIEAATTRAPWGPYNKVNKLTTPTGTFNSENYPNNYLPLTHERWQITVGQGMVVKLSFDKNFNMEKTWLGQCADYVQIMDGRYASNDICGNKNPLIARVCGNQAPAMPIYSTSNTVLVELCTDPIRQYMGFNISYMATKPPPKPTQPPSKCGKAASQFQPENVRIVGGTHAKPHSWPWAVALFTGTNASAYQFCGGSLINEGWVMTAGHCFYGQTDMSKFRVKLGADNKGTGFTANEKSQQVVGIDKAIVNPKFDPNKLTHDMTLLKLKKKVTINDYVKPVCLPAPTDDPKAGTPTEIVGWGTTTEGAPFTSPTLMQVSIPIYDHDKCHAEYAPMGYNVDDTMICAALENGGKDSCQGDSGGPLMVKKDDGAWYLEGIVSWGRGCAEPHYAGVYGKVSSMLEWAMATIQKNGMPTD